MRKALVVGINDYPKAPLFGCVNDATAIANVLATHSNGDPNFSVMPRLSPGQSITRSSLRQAIEELFSGDPDIALLYFSGHGHLNSLGGYVVTSDFESYDEGVSMDDLLKYAANSKAKEKVIILDCCHSGACGSPNIAGGNAMLCEGLSILTACRDIEPAIEKGGSGIFTSLVVSALQGGASDLTGHITPGSIYAYVDQALGPWHQRPIFKTNVSRFTSLRRVSPNVPVEVLRKLAVYFVAPEDQFRLDPSYEFTNSNDQPPIKVVPPEADNEHVEVMKHLQSLARVGLVVPVDAEHMYFAAMESKACQLTALGAHYWRLVKDKHI